jgi:hypothetical protein
LLSGPCRATAHASARRLGRNPAGDGVDDIAQVDQAEDQALDIEGQKRLPESVRKRLQAAMGAQRTTSRQSLAALRIVKKALRTDPLSFMSGI